MTSGHHGLKPRAFYIACSALLALGCGEAFSNDGSGASGGTSAGGGGSAAGGSTTGGSGATTGGVGGSAAGGSGGTTGGAGGVAAAGAGGAAAAGSGGQAPWECEVNADCGSKGVCVELSPGGLRTCKMPVEHASECVGPNPVCCSDAECNGGDVCVVTPLAPHCGGAQAEPGSVCASDGCATTANCNLGEICVPAGVFDYKVASCRTFLCTKDSDCSAGEQGKCVAMADPCCKGPVLSCVYPGGCSSNRECEATSYCQPGPKGAGCLPGVPAC